MELNKKINELSLTRKISLIVLLLFIAGATFYLAFGLERIDTIKYSSGCVEVFVDGEINGSYCELDRLRMEQRQMNPFNVKQYDLPDINIS